MKHILLIGKNSYIAKSFATYMNSHKNVEVELIGAKDDSWKTVDFSVYDVVIHVAAIVHKKENLEMQELYQKVNSIFPVEVAKKAKESGVKKFVFLSSMAVYGKIASPIKNDANLAPVTIYGKSKLQAEKKLFKLADDKFQIVVLRPPMVYGKGCPGNYGRLEKLGLLLPFFPKVKNKRSMIYIENLCECMKQCCSISDNYYSVICPQNQEYVNTTELVKEIRNVSGKKTIIIPFGQSAIKFLARRISTLEKMFGDYYYEKNEQDKQYQVADFKTSVKRTVGK